MLAAAAIGLGALVVVGPVTGHAVGWVAVLGVGVLAALALTLTVRVPLFSGIGDQVEHPVDGGGAPLPLRARHRRLSPRPAGREPPGRSHDVKATLGIGNLIVRVPQAVTVEVDGRASAGDVRLLGHDDNGTHVHDRVVETGTMPKRVLVLDARVGLGELKVTRG